MIIISVCKLFNKNIKNNSVLKEDFFHLFVGWEVEV